MQVMPPRSARSSAPGALPGRRARRKAQRLVEHGRGGRQHTLSSGPGALTFGSLKVLPGRNGTLPSLGTRGGRRGRTRREAGAEEACVSNGRSGHGAASRRQQRGRDARAPAAWRAPIAAAVAAARRDALLRRTRSWKSRWTAATWLAQRVTQRPRGLRPPAPLAVAVARTQPGARRARTPMPWRCGVPGRL